MSLALPWLGHAPDAPFPPAESAMRDPNGLLAAGGDLTATRLLNAYSHGIFPWFSEGEPLLWFSVKDVGARQIIAIPGAPPTDHMLWRGRSQDGRITGLRVD